MKKLLLVLLLAALPAFASGINYVCDTTDAFALPTSVCTTLQTTVAGQYASVFINANANIYIEYGNIGNDVATNTQYYDTVSYQTYYNALKTSSSGQNDATAVGTLPVCTATGRGGSTCRNPLINGDGVALTSALFAALNIPSGAIGITSTGAACTSFTDGSGNLVQGLGIGGTVATSCFNDVIQVSNSVPLYYDTGTYQDGEYDFYTAVEHETNEALGTASCIANSDGTTPALSVGCTNSGAGTSAADLFRYSGAHARSFLGTDGGQAEGSLAYFSIDGGLTNIVPYNNTNNGADYGDFSTTCRYVQDADGCPSSVAAGLNILNDGGVEIEMLDAVGYTVATPEPGTIGMCLIGLAALTAFGRPRQNKT